MKKTIYISACACLLLFFMSCIQKQVTKVNVSSNFLEKKGGNLLYKNKLFTGIVVSFYENENPKREVYYVDGQKSGSEKIWFQNQQLSSYRFYKKGIKVGIHKGWWENGNQKFEYVFNDKGEYTGTVQEWFENGMRYKTFNYVKGTEQGSQKMWKSNGDIRANYLVVNGERFGLIGLKKCNSVSTN